MNESISMKTSKSCNKFTDDLEVFYFILNVGRKGAEGRLQKGNLVLLLSTFKCGCKCKIWSFSAIKCPFSAMEVEKMGDFGRMFVVDN